MSKKPLRQWVGYLDDDINGGLVLYDRKSRHRSSHIVYLYQFSTNQIINQCKNTVKEHLHPLGEHELRHVEKVKAAYLEFKLRCFRHYQKFIDSRYAYNIPSECLSI